jgi:LysM repeat protein
MAQRSPARWLAPVALLGAAVAVLLTVQSIDGGGSDSGSVAPPAASTSTRETTSTSARTTSSTSSRQTRYYVVKEGDVLSAIAASTGVPLATIEQLNPAVDAQSLHAGQKIKIGP